MKTSRASSPASTFTVAGLTMNVSGAAWNATQDFAWGTQASGSTYPTNYIANGSSTPRRIDSIEYSSVPNGATVCKYGLVTGYTCQDVLNNAYSATLGNGDVVGPMVELGNGPSNIAQCGDSGGPLFAGSKAYGIISLGDANGSCLGGPILVYAEINGLPFTVQVPIPE